MLVRYSLEAKIIAMVMAFHCLLTGLSAAPTPGVTDKEVVLGITQPFTGVAAAWGNVAAGSEAWAQYINDLGGIHGRKIKIITRDDGYNPSKAVANIREMKDQVFAIVGLLGTAVIGAAKDDVADYGIPVIGPLGNPEIWAQQPRAKLSRIFVSYPHYEDEGEFLVTQAVNRLGLRRLSVFYQNDDYGKGELAGIRKGIKALDNKAVIVSEIAYEVAERDVSTHALKIRDSQAEAVFVASTVTHGANLIKEMAKVGYRPQIITPWPLGDHLTMFNILGELWEGAYFNVTSAVVGEKPANKVLDILLKYKPDLSGKETFALMGASYMILTAEGLKRSGRDLTRENFSRAMETISAFSPENLGPEVTFSKNRHHGLNTVRLMRAVSAKDKKIEEVTGYQLFPAHF